MSSVAQSRTPTGNESIRAIQDGYDVDVGLSDLLAAAGIVPMQTYLGQVGTGSHIPNNITTNFKSGNGQTFHVARDDMTQLQVAYANWYQNNAVHEAGSGGTLTVTASIQYPIAANPDNGTWQQFKWSAVANTGAIADGETSPLSDVLKLIKKIPRGAGYLMRWHAEATVQIPYWQFTASNSSAYNQVAEGNATPAFYADKTLGGTIAAGSTANNLYPVLMVAPTSRPSLYLAPGDSRVHGIGDTFDATGHTGELARSLGEHFAYCNLGCPSETLQAWLANSTRRQALLRYFSHMLGNMSINDIAAGRTTAQLAADIASAAAIGKAAGKKVVWATICPSSSGTYTTVAGQTVSAANAQRTGVNDLLRVRQIAGVDQVIDIASVIESGLNSGLWAVEHDGTNGVALTGDGIHANYLGYQRIKRSRVVDPNIIWLA